jgi:PAS domain S-box-containing protein
MDIKTDKTFNIQKLLESAPIGIVSFDEQWQITYCNRNMLSFSTNYEDEGEVTGKSLFEIDLVAGVNLKEELAPLKEGEPVEKEIAAFSSLDGGKVSLILKGVPFMEEERFSGGIVIVEDIKIALGGDSPERLSFNEVIRTLGNSNDLFFLTDREGNILYSFGKELRKLPLSPIELSTIGVFSLFTTASRAGFSASFNTAINKRISTGLRANISFGNNERQFKCSIEPIVDGKGDTIFLFVIFNDLKQILKEEQRNDEEYLSLNRISGYFDLLKEAVIVINRKGIVTFWNKAAEELYDTPSVKAVNNLADKAMGLNDPAFISSVIQNLENSSFYKTRITLFNNRFGKKIIEVKFNLAPGGEEIITVCSDITAEAEEEKRLRKENENFTKIIENSDRVICTLDNYGNITYANDGFSELTGYLPEELYKRSIFELIEAKYLQKNYLDLKAFKLAPGTDIELPIQSKNGNEYLLSAYITPSYSKENQFLFYSCFFKNITEEKNSNKEMRIFGALFEAAQDGIAVEKDNKIVIANDSFASIFGYEAGSDLEMRDLAELVSTEDSPKVFEYISSLRKGKNAPPRFELLGRRKDGFTISTEVSLSVFDVNGSKYIVMVVRDITERKRTQQAIRQSEEKYRNITDNIDDFLYTFENIENKLRPVFYTSSVQKITGYSQIDFLSETKAVLKIVHPDDFHFVKKKINGLIRSKIQLSDEFEFRIINKQGNIVWVRNKMNLIRTKEGQVFRIYGLVSDITLRKKTEEELKRTTDNLIKLNETKDRFISIISHDLRTPFSSILGFTDLLLSDSDLNEVEKRQYVGFIQESSKAMFSLVNSLLDWTRLQTGRIRFEPEYVDLSALADQSFNALSGAAFQKEIIFNNNIIENTTVFADKNLIQQVFNNLISNSIKFTKQGGTINIDTKSSNEYRFIEVIVSDTGVGIKKENLVHLFNVDSKFTSEGTAGEKGSGLGLSLVKEIIEKHSGKLRVESEYGAGSSFIFTIPVSPANILLIDNNKTDRLLYSKILKNITPDYTVEIVSNGAEALERIMSSPPALIITEHLMPEMNGYEFILEMKKRLMKFVPPVIILSRNLDRSAIEDYRGLEVKGIYQKPFNLSDFKNSVEKALKKSLKNGGN